MLCCYIHSVQIGMGCLIFCSYASAQQRALCVLTYSVSGQIPIRNRPVGPGRNYLEGRLARVILARGCGAHEDRLGAVEPVPCQNVRMLLVPACASSKTSWTCQRPNYGVQLLYSGITTFLPNTDGPMPGDLLNFNPLGSKEQGVCYIRRPEDFD